MLNHFAACMPFMLAMECPYPKDWNNPRNFSNTPHDPGGATMCGIIQREYNRYRTGRGEPQQSVRLISIHEGWNIYLFGYWNPHSPVLPAGLDLSFFDTAVNCGSGGAIKVLQAALDIGVDGIWGPVTTAAVADITDVAGSIAAFCGARAGYYRRLKNYVYFGKGWIRRALAIQQDSLLMLSDSRALRTPPPRAYVPTVKAYDDGDPS